MTRAELLKEAGLDPKAFCAACWHHVKRVMLVVERQERERDQLITVGVKLKQALEHAEYRLNQLPHHYDDTDFALIREAREAAEESILDEQHTGESDSPSE